MVTGAPSRIVVTDVAPSVAGRRHPVKRVEGEPVDVRATVICDGHDELWVVLSHQPPGAKAWVDVPMGYDNPGLDRWGARFTPIEKGTHRFKVLAWVDHYASLAHGTMRKVAAGLDVTSELLQAAAMLDEAAAGATRDDAALLKAASARLRAGDTIDLTDTGSPDRPSAAELRRRRLRRTDAASSSVVEVLVERERAAFSAWYELFPRSTVSWRRRRPSRGRRPRHPARRHRPARLRRRPRLRHPLPAAGPPHRAGLPQGTRQRARRRPRRPRQPVGDRRGRGRPHRGAPRARHGRRRARPRRRGEGERHRGRPRPRLPVLARPPLGHRAPRVVPPPARRHHPVRREPAEEVPGHLPARLRVAGVARAVGGPARRRRVLDGPGHHRVPGRQPPHQAVPVLGVAHRAGAPAATPT